MQGLGLISSLVEDWMEVDMSVEVEPIRKGNKTMQERWRKGNKDKRNHVKMSPGEKPKEKAQC